MKYVDGKLEKICRCGNTMGKEMYDGSEEMRRIFLLVSAGKYGTGKKQGLEK